MNVDKELRFVAQPGLMGVGPDWSPKRAYGQMYGFLAVLIAAIFAVPVLMKVLPTLMNSVSLESKAGSEIVVGAGFGILLLVLAAMGLRYRRHNAQEIVIGVADDGLTVSTRRRQVFAFGDLTLGPWGWGAGAMGTALHLHCGQGRFVLGGRDYRVGDGTRLDEPAVPGVDAWLQTAEFGQLLTVVGGRAGLAVNPPTPADSTRFMLFPNPQRVQALSPSAVRKQHKLLRSASNLAVEIDADIVRVMDPNTNALVASAPRASVTAMPATYHYPYSHWYPSVNNVMSDMEMEYLSKAPELVVSVPGMQRLAIACLDVGGALGTSRRFSWGGDVQTEDEPAQYAVSGADWVMLVGKFGLAEQLQRHDEHN